MEQLPLSLCLLSARMKTVKSCLVKDFEGGLSCANIRKTEN